MLLVPQDERTVAFKSKYFLRCPVTSHHAEYTWHGPGSITTACKNTENQCHLLIDSMDHENQGDYRCTAVELGYNRTVVLTVLTVKEMESWQYSSVASLGQDVGWVVAINLLQLRAIAVLQSTE